MVQHSSSNTGHRIWELIATNLELRAKISENARQRAKEYTLDAYRQRLIALLGEI
jgi:glycosyltransferase involved in cell wall biosynthesis